MGDINVHSKRWLFHSTGNSTEGERLKDLCLKENLRQLVWRPTRGDHLLDLAITDIESAAVSICPKIADHLALMVRLNLSLPECFSHCQDVWSFAKADWDGLKEDLGATDWSFLGGNDASSGAELMTRLVLSSAAGRIPKREITIKKKSRPWLMNESCNSWPRNMRLVVRLTMQLSFWNAAKAAWRSSQDMRASRAKNSVLPSLVPSSGGR